MKGTKDLRIEVLEIFSLQRRGIRIHGDIDKHAGLYIDFRENNQHLFS